MKYRVVINIEITDNNSEANGGIYDEDGGELEHIESRDMASIAWHLTEAGSRALHRMIKETYYK